MLEEYLVTDMAADAMERQSLTDIASAKQLSYGIVKRTADLTSPALAKRLGREAGVYVTFDAPPSALFSDRALRSLANHLAGALVGLTGVQGAGSRVLAVGLGNDEIAADRLGDAAVKLLRVTPASAQGGKRRRVRLSAFSAGVEGVTGIRTVEVVEGVCSRVRPSCVIAIDSLATASPSRLGTSFQLTTAGITPSGGLGAGRAPVCRAALGVPVIGIGVPLVLSLRTALSDLVRDYAAATGRDADEFAARRLIGESDLGSLVVAPKDVASKVERAARVIADAVNIAFGEQ